MYEQDVLAANIKKYRIKTGYTQAELADKLFVSTQAISKWERGQSLPDLSNLCTLSDIFKISVDKLIGNVKEKSDQKVFVGIDGGGTKTEFLLFSEDGHILYREVFGASNPNVTGGEKCLEVLKSGIDTMLGIHSEVDGVFCGIAGCSSADNKKLIYDFFKKTFPALKVNINSDIVNVMCSVPELDECIAAICGTGFSVFANVNDDIHRIGGWGYLLGKNGSGFDIGRDALSAVLAYEDGFGEKTIITDLVYAKLGTTVWESVPKIYEVGNSFIASFAPIVFKAYENGDEIAKKILDENAKSVAYLIEQAVAIYDCGKNVILSGGLCNNDDIYRNLIREKLDSRINLIVPNLPQIYGACVKCCKLYGNFSDKFTKNFKNDYVF